MQRRASERIPSNFTVRFSCCNCDYEGTAMNISEEGMFITTNRMSFPFDSDLEILVHTGSEILKVPATVMRINKSRDYYDCLGVKIQAPSQNYIRFVQSFKSGFWQFFITSDCLYHSGFRANDRDLCNLQWIILPLNRALRWTDSISLFVNALDLCWRFSYNENDSVG